MWRGVSLRCYQAFLWFMTWMSAFSCAHWPFSWLLLWAACSSHSLFNVLFSSLWACSVCWSAVGIFDTFSSNLRIAALLGLGGESSANFRDKYEWHFPVPLFTQVNYRQSIDKLKYSSVTNTPQIIQAKINAQQLSHVSDRTCSAGDVGLLIALWPLGIWLPKDLTFSNGDTCLITIVKWPLSM